MSPSPVPSSRTDRELIARLTGVRSAKPNYYRQYRHTAEGLDRSIRALEAATGAIGDVMAGPRQLMDDFVCAAVRVFDVPWAAAVVEHPSLGTEPVVIMAGPDGRLEPGAVPDLLADVLGLVPGGAVEVPPLPGLLPAGHLLSCALGWPDGRGWLAVGLDDRAVDPIDEALLGTLAHQVEASVRSAQLMAEAERMQAETAVIRQELAAMRAQEQLDRQREHLARDLHDTVVQQVLGIGFKLEWCRGRVADEEVAAALLEGRELARATIERIRSTIAELTSGRSTATGLSLVRRIRDVVDEFEGRGPTVTLRAPRALPDVTPETDRAVEMIVREAVANAVVHACATVVGVSITGADGQLVVEVADDGVGRPERMRAHLREALQHRGVPYGRGLANAFLRAREAGGSLEIVSRQPGRSSGVVIRATVPALPDGESPTFRVQLPT